MKTKLYILALIFSLFAVGCSDWLDVKSSSEIDADEAFASEEGFKSVLIGAYLTLSSDSLYGRNATWHVSDAIARNWNIPTNMTSELYLLQTHNYKSRYVESRITNMWSYYYRSILQINILLENLDNTKVQFSYNNDRLIKGEALGLRAFLHLEALRFFGPIPDENASSAQSTIPYVKERTKDPNKLISLPWSEVIANIEADLNAAEELLNEIDPILSYSNPILNQGSTGNKLPEDSWQWARQGRFNYYAVLGTKARLYHWMGDKSKAIENAKKVIEAPEPGSTPATKFYLANSGYAANMSNYVMRCEHLFGIHKPDFQDEKYTNLFYDARANPTFHLTIKQKALLFENDKHPLDIRSTVEYWTINSGNYALYNKYRMPITSNINRIPLLRLSEMYFILIENLPLAEAKGYLRTFAQARLLNENMEETLIEENRLNMLENEHRKDFFGEGQMFFFYKKHKYERFAFPNVYEILNPTDVYVLPKPNSQIIFE